MNRVIINAMNIDELRNYVIHQEEQLDACHGVISNQKEVIDIQRRLISEMPSMYEAINCEERRVANLSQLEIGLRHKYEDLIQKQDIGCCPVEKTPWKRVTA